MMLYVYVILSAVFEIKLWCWTLQISEWGFDKDK